MNCHLLISRDARHACTGESMAARHTTILPSTSRVRSCGEPGLGTILNLGRESHGTDARPALGGTGCLQTERRQSFSGPRAGQFQMD